MPLEYVSRRFAEYQRLEGFIKGMVKATGLDLTCFFNHANGGIELALWGSRNRWDELATPISLVFSYEQGLDVLERWLALGHEGLL